MQAPLLVACCSFLPALVPEVWQSGNTEEVRPSSESGPDGNSAQVHPTPVSASQTQADFEQQTEGGQLMLAMEKLVLAEDLVVEKDKAKLCSALEIREQGPDEGPISLPSTEAYEGSR